MSKIIHPECPGIELHQDRDLFSTKRALIHFLANLRDLGYQHCMHYCAKCKGRVPESNPYDALPGNRIHYQTAFKLAHDKAGEIPEHVYNHLVSLANGDCPVCSVVKALKQFPEIERASESPLFSHDSLPCFLGKATDKTGFKYDAAIKHVHALWHLDITELPVHISPANELRIRTHLEPGKAIIDFLQSVDTGESTIPAYFDSATPNVLFNHNKTSSNAQAAAAGGKGGDAKAISAPVVAPEFNNNIKVEAINLSPLAEAERHRTEAERHRQEQETERTRIIAAALTGKAEVAPAPNKADLDGYTIQEYTDYVSGIYKTIDTGTARNILKDAGIRSIGKRTASQGRPDVFPRQEAENAAEKYVEKKKHG